MIVLGVGCGMAGVWECMCDCVGGGVWYGWCVEVLLLWLRSMKLWREEIRCVYNANFV